MFISFIHFFRFLYYKITKICLAYLNFTFPYLAALSVRSLHQGGCQWRFLRHPLFSSPLPGPFATFLIISSTNYFTISKSVSSFIVYVCLFYLRWLALIWRSRLVFIDTTLQITSKSKLQIGDDLWLVSKVYCINILHFFKRRILTTFYADILTKFSISVFWYIWGELCNTA